MMHRFVFRLPPKRKKNRFEVRLVEKKSGKIMIFFSALDLRFDGRERE